VQWSISFIRSLWSRLVKTEGASNWSRLVNAERAPNEPRLKGADKIRIVTASSLTLLFLTVTCSAGPVEFGLAQYNAALDARNIKQRIKYDVSLEPAESFRIEPYAAGGAHISGGDLRGLMYALLEAADQIRATGRMKQTHSVPSIAIRAIRRFARDDVSDWQPYFEMLARDRFNRFTLIFTEPPTDLGKLRTISQLAADYAVDFTLALWFAPDESVARILAACPMIRTVQIRESVHDLDAYRTRVFKPIHDAGRRIALDLDPEVATVAQQEGIAIRSDSVSAGPSWPPNFEIEAPADYASHAEFYWLWGRLGYDPKSKPAHGEQPDEVAAAAQIVSNIAIARGGTNEWAATIRPVDLANALATAAGELESSTVPDLQLLAKIARDEATKQRASSNVEESPGPLARPVFTHPIVHNATPDQTINLTLQIAPVPLASIKDIRMVRLHYRTLTATSTTIVEKPAALSLSFAIPPQPSDILYYFGIVDQNGRERLEPDPITTTPYHIIRVQAPIPPQ
jgi:hypothetical protein